METPNNQLGSNQQDPGDQQAVIEAINEAKARPVLKARLIVNETVYHQHPIDQGSTVISKFIRILDSDEQPYLRRLMVKEEWQPLDCGWLETASLVRIANEEGKGLQVWPTEEEKLVINSRVVQLGLGVDEPPGQRDMRSPPKVGIVPFAAILPGESTRIQFLDLHKIYLRCIGGQARINLALIPN